MIKRIIAFVAVVTLACILIGCGAREPKDDIIELVEERYDVIVTACKNKDKQALLAIDGINKVNIVDGHVLVFCQAKGISVSSHDYGFYYSEKGTPVVIDSNLEILRNVKLLPEGQGYQCEFGGNTFYTEHIKGNVYFYSNAY